MKQGVLFPRQATRPDVAAIIERVDGAACPTWKDEALEAVRRTCLAVPDFISDDVWRFGSLSPAREDRALGPVMVRAAKLGYCKKSDRVRPSRRSNLSGKPVWISNLYGVGRA